MWDDLFKGLCPHLLAVPVAVTMTWQRDWEGHRTDGCLQEAEVWQYSFLILVRVEYQAEEGIFKQSANPVRECTCGLSIAMEFWKSDLNASFGRELLMPAVLSLIFAPTSPRSSCHGHGCSSQGTSLGGVQPASCRGYCSEPSDCIAATPPGFLPAPSLF